MEKEKKRSTNFSTFETNLLIKLVEEQKHVLDPQKLNAASLNMKHGAWREITTNFNNNSQIKTYRDEKALKKKYSNLKCDAKNWPTLRNEALAKLGGNSETENKPTKKEEKFLVPKEISRKETVKSKRAEEKDYLTYLKEIENRETEETSSHAKEFAEPEPKDSKSNRKRSQLLDKQTQELLNSIAEKRSKLTEKEAELRMELLETEHQERMKFLRLKHSMTMKRLDLEKERCKEELDLLKTEAKLKEKLRRRLVAQTAGSGSD